MNHIYLRSKSDRYTLAVQEKNIKDYMSLNGYDAGGVEVEVAPATKHLDERTEFKEFLHSLNKGDRIFVYDLRALSSRIGELVQILNCIFNHDLELVVTKYGVKIDKETPAHIVISLLNQQREENRQEAPHTGRPKGSISKSKYDKYRERIIELIKEGKSVSEIAKILDVSRSSIRDYIASRELKKVALGKSSLEVEELPQTECKINQKG